EPMRSGFFGAHFYAPAKWVSGVRIPTLWANALVLWMMAITLAFTLYFELFPRLLRLIPTKGAH
ncbi:MAG TPA: hypothetical protein PLL57_15355, partial [Flavobacteriales bacterium]|nr:hypothetical protein [Flavobacteriales bacterium]